MNINKFSEKLLKWNKYVNNRKMPWKGEKDPYKVWLSEIILQQTRVEQGLGYYLRFIEAFPTVEKLALADEKAVFKLWEGLGYYSRCRNLIAAARFIYFDREGLFPDTYEEILALKGVGPYTAAAIASFAFNQPFAVLDGNVFRVLARVFGIEEAIDSTAGKKKFAALASRLIDQSQPALYNQAIMDFGATICKPVSPVCPACIFKTDCTALKEDRVASFPVKEKKIRRKKRYFYFFNLSSGKKIALQERTAKDVWRHLYQFPLIESDVFDTDKALKKAEELGWIKNKNLVTAVSRVYRQALTHQDIHAIFISVDLASVPGNIKDWEWVDSSHKRKYSFPKLINDYFSESAS